jgi:hypothetical protein
MYDHEVVYAYDGLGRKQEIEYPTDNPSNPFHVSYEYDNLNCLISVKLNDVELAMTMTT